MRSEPAEKSGGGNPDEKHRPVFELPEPAVHEIPEFRKNLRKAIENKNWWAPLWKGLVVDEGAAHFQKIGIALWLYGYLIVNANRGTGVLMRRAKTISTDMGLPRSTVFRWLKTLRDAGYIETRSSGHSLAIKIHKWRPVGDVSKLRQEEVSTPGQERSQFRDTRSPKSETSQMPSDTPKPAWLKEKLAAWAIPKENVLKENNLKRRIDRKKFDFKNFDPIAFKTREELLAYDLAKVLDDFPGFPLYLTLARKYSESLLRKTLGRVREIPAEEIKTSRGALFNFLIQKNEIKSTFDPRH